MDFKGKLSNIFLQMGLQCITSIHLNTKNSQKLNKKKSYYRLCSILR
jgi:hypothetical protein